MCTPALRELKRLNPTTHIRFFTDFPTLVRGLPYIDEVVAFEEQPGDAIYLDYFDALPPRVHIAKIIGDNLGLKVTDVRPDCMIDHQLIGRFRGAWSALPHPHIVVHRYASSFSPNKDWPESHWVKLIANFSHNELPSSKSATESPGSSKGCKATMSTYAIALHSRSL